MKAESDEYFDYDRYKRLLAEATDEPKRTALIKLLIEERAFHKLASHGVKQRVAQFVASNDVGTRSYIIGSQTSPTRPVTDVFAGLAGGEEINASPSTEEIMKKPTKSAAELEAMIKVEIEAISDHATGTIVSVRPDGDSWKAQVVSESSVDDADLHDMITQIAYRLKTEFDLSA
jgi:hypothetical protein